MNRLLVAILVIAGSIACRSGVAQPSRSPLQGGTRPPEDIARGLRPLTPEEIPPNLNFYTLDPFYNPDAKLGWSEKRIEEKLGRGVVAKRTADTEVYISWRLLKDDAPDIAFDVYRSTDGGDPVKLNDQPIAKTTDFVDASAALDRANVWSVRIASGDDQTLGEAALSANSEVRQYQSIELADDIRTVDKVGVGDLNGDGVYDYVVKHPATRIDPGRIAPSRDTYKIDAYDGKSGQQLWRIDLGWNIDQGIWFSPMAVRDLDGDNCAEVCLRTAPYAAAREESFSGGEGIVLKGPEYLTVYDGRTGEPVDQVDWIDRGKVTDWADNTGNRASRHMMGVAYLDGKTPAVLVVRGIYGLMKIEAWTLEDRKLQQVWRWSNERASWKYQGQGQHSIHVADVDGDGCDEILNGSICIDNDGRTMWSTGMGHGDRFYVSDIDPNREGLEVWYSYEDPHPVDGCGLWDARTGRIIFGLDVPIEDNQISRALAADIDPRYPGMECWADGFFFTAHGERLEGPPPPRDGLVWWDADPLRELQTRRGVSKWNGPVLTQGISGRVAVWADVLGDWREEIITTTRDGELRIYSTTIPATDRRVCLMQDPLYRHDVTLKAMGYDQTPMTSYFLGVETPP